MNAKRTHDKFYLNENYRSNPKEYYKMVRHEMDKDFDNLECRGGDKGLSFLDIGCETGSFLYYLRACYPEAKLAGIDVMEELLAKVNEPQDIGISTFLADISDDSTLPSEKYDVVTCLGVLGIFDDFDIIIRNIMSLLKESGVAYIFSMFNPEKLDMIMRCRPSGGKGAWEKGWNVFSIESLSVFCQENGWKYEFIPFEMPFEIPKHETDPLRSWTINNGDKLMVINGLQLIHNFYLLKIVK